MKLLLTLMTLTTLAIFSLPEATGQCACSAGWTSFDWNCYRYFSEQVSWAAAQTACEGYGANLVSIHSQAEDAFVYALIVTDDGEVPTGVDGFAWIGLHKPIEPFAWSDGSCLTYDNWGPGQPDNYGGNEDCGHLRNFNPPGSWNDWPCYAQIGYICKK